MATDMLQYLDPDGLDETVLNIGQIKTSLEGQISDLGESIEAEMQDLTYARPDGIYPDMTVGAVIGADSTAQWAQRTTEGSGAATVRSVQGAAVVWNQLYRGLPRDNTVEGMTYTVNADGSITVDGTATSDGRITLLNYITTEGHKYLYKGCPANGSLQTYVFGFSGTYGDTGNGYIVTADSNLTRYLSFFIYTGVTLSNVTVYPQLFDLTQMFGSGNEPSTVAEFERMYPESYYPYSAPTLKPVQISGIRSTTAQGGELDSVEWPTQTLRAAGSVADMLYSDHVDVNVGVADAGSAWIVEPSSPVNSHGMGYALLTVGGSSGAFSTNLSSNVPISTTLFAEATQREFAFTGQSLFYRFPATAPYTAADAIADMQANNVACFYPLATATTTPISPALPMSYKVEQGGSEAIIVPDGEVSAAPIITVAEPINAGDEFARIWEAIQSLGYTRNVAQLSQPISLVDIGSIDEVQKDTTDVVEIDTTKEVQE